MFNLNKNKFTVRCRGIIVHDGKLLVVRHSKNTKFVALPGGHLDWGEDIITCIKRELVEELGIEPEIGQLLYVHTFTDNNEKNQSVEFFFEIKNSSTYIDYDKQSRTHAHELAEIIWVTGNEDIQILPEEIKKDLQNGTIIRNSTKYISQL